MLSGVALGDDGQELGSMGVDFADYDHDGKLDLFVTNYTDQINNLYRNLGGGTFSICPGRRKSANQVIAM